MTHALLHVIGIPVGPRSVRTRAIAPAPLPEPGSTSLSDDLEQYRPWLAPATATIWLARGTWLGALIRRYADRPRASGRRGEAGGRRVVHRPVRREPVR